MKRAPFRGMTYSSDVLGSLRLGQVCNPTVFQGTSQSSTAPAQGGGHGWRTRQPALSRNMERHADTQQPNFPQGSFGPQARLHGGSLQALDFHTLIRTGSPVRQVTTWVGLSMKPGLQPKLLISNYPRVFEDFHPQLNIPEDTKVL